MKLPHEVDVGDLVRFRHHVNLPLENVGLVMDVWASLSGKRRLIRYVEVLHAGKILTLYAEMYEVISKSL
jgi:hypothetical protein